MSSEQSQDPQGGRYPGALPLSVVAALCAVAGTAIGLFVVPRAPSAGSVEAETPVLSLLGKALPADSTAEKLALESLRELGTRTFSLHMPDGSVIAQSLAKWGGTADEERAQILVSESLDASSPLRRHFTHVAESDMLGGTNKNLVLPVPFSLETDKGTSAL